MNMNPILSITIPASIPLAQGQSVETVLDFDALMGQATNPLKKNAAPKPDALPPLEMTSPETHGTPGVPAAPVAREIGLPPASAGHFNIMDRHIKGDALKQDRLPAQATIAVAEPGQSSPAKPIDTPVTAPDLKLRFSKEIGKHSMIDTPVVDETENEQPKPTVSADTQLPKAVPGQTAKPPVAPQKIVDTGHSNQEPQDKMDVPLSDLPAAAVQISGQATPVTLLPATSVTARVSAPVQANPAGDAPREIKKSLPLADKGAEKILLAAAELPAKIQSTEATVTQFSIPTTAAQVTVTTTMTAPLFAAPDNFATQQLDLARDTQWIEQLTREIVSIAGQDGKLRFGLAPDGLGHLEVMVDTQQDGVNIQFQTSTENAAKIIAAEQPKLLEELRQSGVRVANGDLMAGHQMHGQRDQSRNPNPAWQMPSSQPERHTPSSHPNTSHSGRFA